MMMRVVPGAAKALAFASSSTSRPTTRYAAFTALRMMSAAAPTVKVGCRWGRYSSLTSDLLFYL